MKNFKKMTLLMLACIATVANIKAQDGGSNNDDKIRFGLKAGANYSNVYDATGENFVADGKFGLAAGGFLTIPIGDFLAVQPEFLFSQKGFKGSGTIIGLNYELMRTTSYIDVPLFVSLRPVPFLSILAGPQFSYLVSQKDDFLTSLGSLEIEQEFNNDNLRKNTLCFVGGVDFNIEHFVVSARAGWDVMSNRGDGTSTTPRYKNMWVQATVGFRF